MKLLTLLNNRHGLDYDTGLTAADGTPGYVRDLLEEIYERAGDNMSGMLSGVVPACWANMTLILEQAATEILVRQHALSLGRNIAANQP